MTVDLAYILWMQSLSGLLDLVIPSEGQSLVYEPPIANNVSSFSLSFNGPILMSWEEANGRVRPTYAKYPSPR